MIILTFHGDSSYVQTRKVVRKLSLIIWTQRWGNHAKQHRFCILAGCAELPMMLLSKALMSTDKSLKVQSFLTARIKKFTGLVNTTFATARQLVALQTIFKQDKICINKHFYMPFVRFQYNEHPCNSVTMSFLLLQPIPTTRRAPQGQTCLLFIPPLMPDFFRGKRNKMFAEQKEE